MSLLAGKSRATRETIQKVSWCLHSLLPASSRNRPDGHLVCASVVHEAESKHFRAVVSGASLSRRVEVAFLNPSLKALLFNRCGEECLFLMVLKYPSPHRVLVLCS